MHIVVILPLAHIGMGHFVCAANQDIISTKDAVFNVEGYVRLLK